MLHRVEGCGYYTTKQWEARSAPSFGPLPDTLAALATWGLPLTLGETATYDPDPDTDIAKAYLLDIASNTKGDTLLVLWEAADLVDGKLSAVASSDRVGQSIPTSTSFAHDAIPGRPSYFFFPAGTDYVASVRLKSKGLGLRPLAHYLSGFLRTVNANHVAMAEDDQTGEMSVVGYRSGPSAAPIRGMKPRFLLTGMLNSGEAGYLRKNYTKIRVVEQHASLTPSVQLEKDLWQAALSFLHIGGSHRTLRAQTKIKFELPFTPSTPAELDRIISGWELEAINHDNFENLGFRLQGERKTRWLDAARPMEKFDLLLDWVTSDLVTTNSLLDELTARRAKIVSLKT